MSPIGLGNPRKDGRGRHPGRVRGAMTGAALLLLLAAGPVAAQDTFLNSQEYGAEGTVIGVLLTDDEYGRMVREAEHLEGTLDWAWVEGRMKGGKVESLGFSIDDYRTIVVQPPVDHTAGPIDGLAGQVNEALLIGCKRIGWTPGEEGELVLMTAIVGVDDPDGYGITNFFNATSKHAVEFEFKLVESTTGNTLLAARHEAHSANLIGASWRATANLVGAYQTTINVDATYTLTDNRTDQVVMEEKVVTSATMSALEVASGSKRMKRVTPAAFLDNVDVFLYRLDASLR